MGLKHGFVKNMTKTNDGNGSQKDTPSKNKGRVKTVVHSVREITDNVISFLKKEKTALLWVIRIQIREFKPT